MAKTSFNINKTDVYYTLIGNEVYALRFKALLVNIPSLSERDLDIDDKDISMSVGDFGPLFLKDNGNKTYPNYLNHSEMVLFDQQTDRKFSNKGIDYIVIEIAPLGEERVWTRHGYNSSDSFNPFRIHRTIKDCVDKVNPVFIKHRDAKVWPTQPYVIPLNEITPNKLMWENTGTLNIYNLLVWRLRTWMWNGYKATKENVCTVNNRMGFHDPYHRPLFDLLEGKFLFDEELLEHAYPSEEECIKHNSIAVHLFMNGR